MSLKAPPRMGAAGRTLWRQVTDSYALRVDERLILEKACRTLDDTARLEAALADAPLMVRGSMGQDRPNPILGEVRASRQLLAQLLRQLALPDVDAGSVPLVGADSSEKARAAARARWEKRRTRGTTA